MDAGLKDRGNETGVKDENLNRPTSKTRIATLRFRRYEKAMPESFANSLYMKKAASAVTPKNMRMVMKKRLKPEEPFALVECNAMNAKPPAPSIIPE
ncbi:hypothetical protein [Paraburkholderia sp. RL17-337-BIB-A]|uniref:hypothetical protein n=1 Tax=Paraburkholderia sp. RL17-337-BIB-A TaxID=3031636 RepID=UPI0038B7EA56